MAKQIYVNLPVEDLSRSIDFFKRLGFSFEPKFTDEKGACMIIGENIFVMLLTRPFFKTFTPKEISDTTSPTEVLVCLSLDNQEEVDDMVSRAVSAGGSAMGQAKDHGFMYGHGFQDPDGHIWELIWMNPGSAG